MPDDRRACWPEPGVGSTTNRNGSRRPALGTEARPVGLRAYTGTRLDVLAPEIEPSHSALCRRQGQPLA